jgi:hypothetical protein
MPLKMRPTGLSSGIYKDSVDYSVSAASGAWPHRRNPATPNIYASSGPCSAPSKPESLRISNQVATLEAAKAEFEASWKQWKAWAKMEGTD